MKDVESYLERIRKRGAHTLQVFESNLDFILAIKSPVGQVLLRDLIERHEIQFSRIASLEATGVDKQVYLYMKGMLEAWVTRIASYEKNVKDFESAAPKAAQKG
uniref:Uncharacterized protein n=1 Tax=viral metagenome TaxID=1070528 RepID=A0A6M3J4R5_9ZZZZ